MDPKILTHQVIGIIIIIVVAVHQYHNHHRHKSTPFITHPHLRDHQPPLPQQLPLIFHFRFDDHFRFFTGFCCLKSLHDVGLLSLITIPSSFSSSFSCFERILRQTWKLQMLFVPLPHSIFLLWLFTLHLTTGTRICLFFNLIKSTRNGTIPAFFMAAMFSRL